eukprot:m.179368 g.179368  ORF g.179368 m.179368 type:complete len:355 (+) comp14746_c0_seq1:35-1099(+)
MSVQLDLITGGDAPTMAEDPTAKDDTMSTSSDTVTTNPTEPSAHPNFPVPSVVGMGTANFGDRELLVNAVVEAVKQGVRLFDTAQGYGSEPGLGEGLAKSGVDRAELWISAKIDLSGEEDAAARVDRQLASTLKNLRTTYLDSVVFHWPMPLDRVGCDDAAIRRKAWMALEAHYHAGTVRYIGVSNWTVPLLKETLSYATVKPAVNQFELSPLVYQEELLEFCKDNDIATMAYSSYGTCWMAAFEPDHVPWPVTNLNSTAGDGTAVEAVAAETGRTRAQVCLRWCLQHGAIVIPKTSKGSRIKEALGALDFTLSDSQMNALNAMRDSRRGVAASLKHHTSIIRAGYKGDQKNKY